MAKRLIVAEKPSVGRDIANVLNCRENGEGCRIGENDVVTWAVGHLVELSYPDEIDDRYKDWKLDDLPIIPEPFRLKVSESGEKQFAIVKKLLNDSSIDRVVCATDAGREGELIFRYIYQVAGCTKPVDRLWISSLTYRAIKEGFENLKPDSDYDDLYESARCRSEADWLVGMNGSRAYAIVNDMRRLSVGRVVSPTLSILVRRELERRNFVPKQYCEVIASFAGFDGRLLNKEHEGEAEWSRFPIRSKDGLDLFVKTHSDIGIVEAVENEEESQPAQQLYDLTSLQRDANRLFGMSSKWTLDSAQSLYEKYKAITYPRTDSRYLSSDIKSTLPKRLESLLGGNLGIYAQKALKSEKDLFGRFIYNKGVSDHHAIIPTGEAKSMDSWNKQEKQIYELICRRFLGMFFPDRNVIHQKLMINVDGKTFVSIGEKVIEAGWSEVDTSKQSNIKELPEQEEKDKVKILSMRLRTDETRPPAPHTEASLLAAMEHAGTMTAEDDPDEVEQEYGIGTPATRAAIIEKMIEKEMVVRRGRTLIPTEYGIQLIRILPEMLQSPEMTGEWEAKLSRIGKGEYPASQFMDEIIIMTRELVKYAVDKGNTGIKKARSVGRCPLCGNPVREYDRAYYCTNRSCSFRQIYKAAKGYHPTLKSITMRELLLNGKAEDEKGTYRLTDKPPYIDFQYAPKPEADYAMLKALIEEYGLTPIDKVALGGGLWLLGDKHDEMMSDFLKEAKAAGCIFEYYQDSKALRHKNGFCHRVELAEQDRFFEIFKDRVRSDPGIGQSSSMTMRTEPDREKKQVCGESKGSVFEVIKESGFEYVDKRGNGGSLWIVAGEKEGKEVVEKCRKLGLRFQFTAKGGRASKHRPAWYSV